MGRVRREQRGDQGRRHRAGHPDLRRHLDEPAVRARRLRQRARSRTPTGPRSTPRASASTSTSRPSRASRTSRRASKRAGGTRTSRPRCTTTAPAWSPPARARTTRSSPASSRPSSRTTPTSSRTSASSRCPAAERRGHEADRLAAERASTSRRPPRATSSRPRRSSSRSSTRRPAARSRTRPMVPSGPYATSACTLPDDVPGLLKDMQPYFDEGNTNPALEFLSPIKGPNLENITVEVGLRHPLRGGRRRAVRRGCRQAGPAARPRGLVIDRPDLLRSDNRGSRRPRRGPRLTSMEMTMTTSRRARRSRPPADRRSRQAAQGMKSMYPSWFYIPAGVLFVVLFAVPTFASFYFALTRWTLFDVDVHRLRQLRDVLPRAAAVPGPHQHLHLRVRHLGR